MLLRTGKDMPLWQKFNRTMNINSIRKSTVLSTEKEPERYLINTLKTFWENKQILYKNILVPYILHQEQFLRICNTLKGWRGSSSWLFCFYSNTLSLHVGFSRSLYSLKWEGNTFTLFPNPTLVTCHTVNWFLWRCFSLITDWKGFILLWVPYVWYKLLP